MPSNSVSCWLEGLKEGDSDAAGALWERYCERLVRLARRKLRQSSRRVADEEDIALSAFSRRAFDKDRAAHGGVARPSAAKG
jgi:hypothetical protein